MEQCWYRTTWSSQASNLPVPAGLHVNPPCHAWRNLVPEEQAPATTQINQSPSCQPACINRALTRKLLDTANHPQTNTHRRQTERLAQLLFLDSRTQTCVQPLTALDWEVVSSRPSAVESLTRILERCFQPFRRPGGSLGCERIQKAEQARK
jgi:hypothetical protein